MARRAPELPLAGAAELPLAGVNLPDWAEPQGGMSRVDATRNKRSIELGEEVARGLWRSRQIGQQGFRVSRYLVAVAGLSCGTLEVPRISEDSIFCGPRREVRRRG